MDELAIELERRRVVLLDVRASEDVVAGHIPGSWLIPAVALAAEIRDPAGAFFQALSRTSAPVAVVAGDPQRLAAVVAMLAEVSVEAVAVTGEVTAWSRAGRPLNRGRDHGGERGASDGASG